MFKCECGSVITNKPSNISIHNKTMRHLDHVRRLNTHVKTPVIKQNIQEEYNIIVDLSGAINNIEEFKFSYKVLLTIIEKRLETLDFTLLSRERFRKITDIVLERGITSNAIISSKIRNYIVIPSTSNIEMLTCCEKTPILSGLDIDTFHLVNTIIFNIIKKDLEKFNQLRAQCCNETAPNKIRRIFLMIVSIVLDDDTLNDILTNQYGDLHMVISDLWDRKIITNSSIRYVVCEYSDKL